MHRYTSHSQLRVCGLTHGSLIAHWPVRTSGQRPGHCDVFFFSYSSINASSLTWPLCYSHSKTARVASLIPSGTNSTKLVHNTGPVITAWSERSHSLYTRTSSPPRVEKAKCCQHSKRRREADGSAWNSIVLQCMCCDLLPAVLVHPIARQQNYVMPRVRTTSKTALIITNGDVLSSRRVAPRP